MAVQAGQLESKRTNKQISKSKSGKIVSFVSVRINHHVHSYLMMLMQLLPILFVQFLQFHSAYESLR